MDKQFSVIIPAYNEEKAIKSVMADLIDVLSKTNHTYEIIVVNDGSGDKTAEQLKSFSQIRIINHPYNKGYGASIKTGMRNAKYDWLVFFDSDGQHKASFIKELLKYQDDYDMVVAARVSGYKGPLIRQPGKKMIHWVANYLSGYKIPDINSGLRLVNKKEALRFLNLYPNAFSISTTMTLAFLKEGLSIKYVPYQVSKRIGKSTVKIRDGFKAIMLILRIIMLFSPLKVFLPISMFVLLLTIVSLIHDILITNLTDTTTLLFISFLLLFSFGLLADQIANFRRGLK